MDVTQAELCLNPCSRLYQLRIHSSLFSQAMSLKVKLIFNILCLHISLIANIFSFGLARKSNVRPQYASHCNLLAETWRYNAEASRQTSNSSTQKWPHTLTRLYTQQSVRLSHIQLICDMATQDVESPAGNQ